LPPTGRLAGIDFGTVRIGIALTDPSRTLASPHESYTRRGERGDAERFVRLVEEEGVVGFVVGLPVLASGDESRLSHEARLFGAWLAQATRRPVVYFDERFTSAQAEEALAQGRLTRKRRKARRDMLAAQIMLAAFLESRSRASSPPGPLE
jgi:putative Holliday junction resolvase